MGVALGSMLEGLIDSFPMSILGVMLVVTGGELASRGIIKPLKDQDDNIIFSIVLGVMLSVDLQTGFIVGLGVHLVKRVVRDLNSKYMLGLEIDISDGIVADEIIHCQSS